MNSLSILLFVSLAIIAKAQLDIKFQWKQVEFDWPCEAAKQAAITAKEYIPENNMPLGLEKWQNKLFVTIPRWKNGVASSLNYVDFNSTDASPKLKPYPSWDANYAPTDFCTNSNCALADNATVVSTFRVKVDQCDRLWVMDTGLVDINNVSLASTQVADNAILIFDLKTDKLIRRYSLPSEQVTDASFFPNIIVDIDTDCSKAFAYLPDLGGYGVVVYSFENNESWRVDHSSFYFDPLQGDFNISGLNFQWRDGVFTMTVGPANTDGSKDVYFHAFASAREFRVPNRVLQNRTLATNRDLNYHLFQYVGDRGENGQSSSEVYDKETNVIFFSEVMKNSLYCWNVAKKYETANLGQVKKDDVNLVFINDMKFDESNNLWILTDRMPTFLYSNLDVNDFNFRILGGKPKDLIKGTPCE